MWPDIWKNKLEYQLKLFIIRVGSNFLDLVAQTSNKNYSLKHRTCWFKMCGMVAVVHVATVVHMATSMSNGGHVSEWQQPSNYSYVRHALRFLRSREFVVPVTVVGNHCSSPLPNQFMLLYLPIYKIKELLKIFYLPRNEKGYKSKIKRVKWTK